MALTDATPVRLGDLLRRARLDAGLDQKQLGALLGVSGGTISNWELGHSEPTATQLRDLAWHTDAEWLYDLRQLPSRWTPTPAGHAA